MSEDELLKIFNTMSFNGGNVKEARLINDNKIYLVMFNQPDMIFYFKNMNDWSLQTAVNFIGGNNEHSNNCKDGSNHC